MGKDPHQGADIRSTTSHEPMNLPPWLTPLARPLLGADPQRAGYVLLVLAASVQLYGVNLAIVWHSVHLGLVQADVARLLSWGSLLTLAAVFAMVRSGWSPAVWRSCADPAAFAGEHLPVLRRLPASG